jgi:uncharacterized coiled-coil protein SlyX
MVLKKQFELMDMRLVEMDKVISNQKQTIEMLKHMISNQTLMIDMLITRITRLENEKPQSQPHPVPGQTAPAALSTSQTTCSHSPDSQPEIFPMNRRVVL